MGKEEAKNESNFFLKTHMLSSLNQNFDHHQMGVNKIWLPLDGYD
jgi:hypothetical protein